MSTRRLLGRRPSTPVRTTTSSRPGQSLPSELLGQTCRRVGIVSIVFASLWVITLILNNIVAGWLGQMAFMQALWPFPGNLVSSIGVASSIGMTWLAHRLSGKPMLLDVGAGYLVLQCLLIAILSQWAPVPISPRVSWVCIPILFYPAIVPNTPRRTLITSLLAASMEPVALGLSHLRGAQVPLNTFYILWDFLPTYICAFLVVIPVKIIHRSGPAGATGSGAGELSAGGAAGQGWNGRGLQGHASDASPAGGGQAHTLGADRVELAQRGKSHHRTIPAGSGSRRLTPLSAHHQSLRLRRLSRRHLLSRHGAPRWSRPGDADRAIWPGTGGAGGASAAAGLRVAGRSPHAGPGPPRHKAIEHFYLPHGAGCRLREGSRLRAGQGHGRGRPGRPRCSPSPTVPPARLPTLPPK